MSTHYSRIFFTALLLVTFQACGGDSDKTTNLPEKEKKQSITKVNYIDLAQYYFQRQSTLIKVSASADSLEDYKARSIPGKETRSKQDTFTISAVTPFNEHVEKMSIQHNSMKIEIDVVRKMYVSIKLYDNNSLVEEVQKTLQDFTTNGLMMPTGDMS